MSKPLQFSEPLVGLSVLSYGDPFLSHDQVAQIRQAAHAQGKMEAEAFYNQQVAESRQEMAELQAGLFESLERRFVELEEVINERMPGLVLELVNRVCAGHSPSVEEIAAVIAEAVSEASPDGAKCEVFLCPHDLELLKRSDAKISGGEQLKISEDPSLSKGDCLVQSRFGLVDARRENKIEQIEEEFGGEQ